MVNQRQFRCPAGTTEPVDFEIPAEWIANSPFPTTAIIGLDDGSQEFTMLYSDARDVFRVYQMNLVGETWTIWRASPGFHQRYTGQFTDDHQTITGFWESSSDGLKSDMDFDLNYTRHE